MDFPNDEMHGLGSRGDGDAHTFRGLRKFARAAEVAATAAPAIPITAAVTATVAIIAATASKVALVAARGSCSLTATAVVAATATSTAAIEIPPLEVAPAARFIAVATFAGCFFTLFFGGFFRSSIGPCPGRAQFECGQQALGQLIGGIAHGAETSGRLGNDKPALQQSLPSFPAEKRCAF